MRLRFIDPCPFALLPAGFNLAGLSRRAVLALAGSLGDTQYPTSVFLPRFAMRRGRRRGGGPYSRVTAVLHVDALRLSATRTRAEGPRTPAFGVPGERRCPTNMAVCHRVQYVVLCRKCRGCATCVLRYEFVWTTFRQRAKWARAVSCRNASCCDVAFSGQAYPVYAEIGGVSLESHLMCCSAKK